MIAGVLTGMLAVELACLLVAGVLIGTPVFGMNTYVWSTPNPMSEYEDAIDSIVGFVAPVGSGVAIRGVVGQRRPLRGGRG